LADESGSKNSNLVGLTANRAISPLIEVRTL